LQLTNIEIGTAQTLLGACDDVGARAAVATLVLACWAPLVIVVDTPLALV